jgi:hypothetical protein
MLIAVKSRYEQLIAVKSRYEQLIAYIPFMESVTTSGFEGKEGILSSRDTKSEKHVSIISNSVFPLPHNLPSTYVARPIKLRVKHSYIF